ncbi:MAG: beta-propeller domain-containing protein, partial [Nitrospira sp.]|nr:beta-propeller domain-containing protein [Nitrospira sp.]
ESAAVLVDVDSPQPREIGRLPVPGDIHESRLVGTALYVASRVYRPSGDASGSWQLETVLSSFDLSNLDAPVVRPEQRLPGTVSAVTADNAYFYIAATQYSQQWTPTTLLHVFDISTPDGSIVPFAEIKVPGSLRDKFKIHRHEDVLRLVVEDQAQPNTWSPITRLLTVRLDRAEQGHHRILGRLDLGPGENLFATRFDGQRAYVVTFRRTDPLWIVDLSDPTSPKVAGELHIPGWSNYIHPLGDRLVPVGIDDTSNWKAAVQLFDVSDPAKPALLSKIPLGDQWSWSEANQDEKALSVFPEDGLILIPFSGSSTSGSQQAVQLIDLKSNDLVRRGWVSHSDLTPRRATLFQNRVFSLSQRELLSVDITDRDRPSVKATLDLSRRVDRLVAAGSHLLSFTDGDVSVVSPAAPDTILGGITLGSTPVLGADVRGPLAYVLQGTSAQTVWSTTSPTLPDTTPIISTNAGKMTLRILDLAALPVIREISQTSWEHMEFTGNDFVALWPTSGTLVWSARQAGGGYPLYLIGDDFLMPPTIRFANDVATPITVTDTRAGMTMISLAPVDSAISLPFGRFWWPGFWYGQRQLLFACDVSNPAQPAFRSTVRGDAQSIGASKAHAADGLVYFSDQFQESEI